ncbi:hypothetical protein AWB67_06402 [Caballeronia terrestris]|uniref:VWFA domain-containing protein n=1 Tax=Caballeronia terrestris TaxID=1226301 RepID=A0A158KSL0_9BURK|nr:hypothetical protein [Caballeronia terrestris]SAL83421.1 hypothetical protein AWB67_06402 [Caballeronia terrestris]
MKNDLFALEESSGRSYLWAAVGGLFVIGVVAAAAVWVLLRPTGLDKRFCPANGPAGQIVLLVDRTDPLSFTQKQAFEGLLDRLVAQRVPGGYLLSVFVLGEDYKSSPKAIFSECNPGDGADASEYTANKAHLKKRFETSFREPMLALADQLQTTKSAKYSPIFEMLKMTSINGFRKEDVKGPRKLIIVSDMLHNTPEFSMYRETPEFASFHGSDYGRKMSTNLNGVDVELDYLINTPRLQTRRNLKFWEGYFASAGARIVAVTPLEG